MRLVGRILLLRYEERKIWTNELKIKTYLVVYTFRQSIHHWHVSDTVVEYDRRMLNHTACGLGSPVEGLPNYQYAP
jgi:hypothetical protein